MSHQIIFVVQGVAMPIRKFTERPSTKSTDEGMMAISLSLSLPLLYQAWRDLFDYFDWHISHSSCIPPLLCRTRFCQEHPLKQSVRQNKCHQQTSSFQTIGCEVWILQAEKNCSKCHGDQSHLWWKGLVQDILHPRWEHQGLNEESKERAKIQENSSWTAMLKSVCCQLS